jgi:hypothetical protein
MDKVGDDVFLGPEKDGLAWCGGVPSASIEQLFTELTNVQSTLQWKG